MAGVCHITSRFQGATHGFVKQVSADVRVDRAQRIVEQGDVAIGIDGASNCRSLTLATAEIDACKF
jgi:hypothetical protein